MSFKARLVCYVCRSLLVLHCIDVFEFGISTVQCTTWEDPNDIDT